MQQRTHLEEVFRGAGLECPVLDLSLFGEVVGGLDRREHALDGEEGGEVGRVRRDDDECEEPPRTADDPTRQRSAALSLLFAQLTYTNLKNLPFYHTACTVHRSSQVYVEN